MYPSEETPSPRDRLPSGLKSWIAQEARRNSTPQNSKIVRALAKWSDRVEAERAHQSSPAHAERSATYGQ
jgi:hypothetical protein